MSRGRVEGHSRMWLAKANSGTKKIDQYSSELPVPKLQLVGLVLDVFVAFIASCLQLST